MYLIIYFVVVQKNYLVLSHCLLQLSVFFMSQAYDLVQGALVSIIYLLVLHFIYQEFVCLIFSLSRCISIISVFHSVH
jgi:hypothetical protein